MNLGDNPQMTTNDLLCVYYETCQTRDCPQRDKHLPHSCPISPQAPKCFCLTHRELNLMCAFVNALQKKNAVTLHSPSLPLPVVDERIMDEYIPMISQCAIAYKTRSGNIVEPQAITTNNDVYYLAGLLLQTYVMYSVIDLEYRNTNSTLDSEWNGTLIKILAGFLYYDAEFAAKYFRVVALELVKQYNKELICEVRKVIQAIDDWHNERDEPKSKLHWGYLSQEVFPTTGPVQATVQDHFIRGNGYRSLQWNLNDHDTVQWAMKFVQVMLQITPETSWLSSRSMLEEITKDFSE